MWYLRSKAKQKPINSEKTNKFPLSYEEDSRYISESFPIVDKLDDGLMLLLVVLEHRYSLHWNQRQKQMMRFYFYFTKKLSCFFLAQKRLAFYE